MKFLKILSVLVFASHTTVLADRPLIVYMSTPSILGTADSRDQNAGNIAIQSCLMNAPLMSAANCKLDLFKKSKDMDQIVYRVRAVEDSIRTFSSRITMFESRKDFLVDCDEASARTRAMVDCAQNCDYDCEIINSVSVRLDGELAPKNLEEFDWLAKSKLRSCVHVTKTACVNKSQ